ncbi:MAG: ABC transporter permease [Streptosporangiaceae bacterium]
MADAVSLTRGREKPVRVRRDPQLVVGTAVAFAWVAIAVTVPWWAPYAPNHQNIADALTPPSAAHWFGTDELGRDVLTRVMYGARVSLPLAAIAVTISAVTGTLIGCVAALSRRAIDETLQRIGDVVLAFPALVLALAIAAALGPSLRNVVIAISAVTWPEYARLARGDVLKVKNDLHVMAARSVGCSPARILGRHILPFTAPSLAVKATLDVGQAVLLAAGLSFIGVGAVPPTPEWGSMISQAQNEIAQWWTALFPGLAILTVVLAFNFVGDSLRDWLDPRSPYRRRGMLRSLLASRREPAGETAAGA